MSPRRTRLKTVLLYLLLVGIPAYGVATIIRLGERIRPPLSVGGIWRLDAVSDAACAGRPLPDSLVATIDQSGPHLRVHLNRLANPLEGELTGSRFDVTDGTLRITAQLPLDTGLHVLTGSIAGLTCAGGMPVPVTGQRVHSGALGRAR